MSDSDTIKALEEQIAQLQEALRREKQKKESLWNDIYELFLSLEMGETEAETTTSKVRDALSEWVNKQRNNLGNKIAKSGNIRMPVYTDCLNDLIYALSPPGTTRYYKEVEPLEFEAPEVEAFQPESVGPNLPPQPPIRYLREEEEFEPMDKLNSFSKRVNVPKPHRKPAGQA